jgi:hypothetical protein
MMSAALRPCAFRIPPPAYRIRRSRTTSRRRSVPVSLRHSDRPR